MKAAAVIRNEAVSAPKRDLWAVCRVGGCGSLAVLNGMCERCFDKSDAPDDLYRVDTDPAYAVRRAKRDGFVQRLLVAFLFVLGLEGAMCWAFSLFITWAWLAFYAGWALGIGVLVAWLGGLKEKS